MMIDTFTCGTWVRKQQKRESGSRIVQPNHRYAALRNLHVLQNYSGTLSVTLKELAAQNRQCAVSANAASHLPPDFARCNV